MFVRRLLCAALVLSVLGCASTPQTTPGDKRDAIDAMAEQTLAELYALKDSARVEVETAPGYAVFNSAGIKLLLLGGSGGRGVVVDRSGQRTYMGMAEVGAGIGLGVKEVRAVFVFDNQATLEHFIANGVTLGASAEAAAKAADRGEAAGGKFVANGMTIYQMTDAGLALEMMVSGTKYWPIEELNELR